MSKGDDVILAKKNKLKKLSIIIPVYNEEKTLAIILNKVLSVKLPSNIEKEIIIVNDGSKDKSESIIKLFVKKYPQIKYFYKKNGGKGSAIRLGLKKSIGDILVIQDADLEYDPQDFKRMIKPIISGQADVVYGSRYLSPKGHLKENNHTTFQLHWIGNTFLSLMTSILYFKYITDMETCYKMFTREVYSKLNLTSNTFDIEPEITAKILKNKHRIVEISIKYFSRDFSEGKKITWRDGIKALFSLIKWRFKN
ncbi:MAG: glycosyltransferase family 2 protein [Candidatus Woesearchaeota archaeon]